RCNGPSMARCSSIGIHADCPPDQRQNSACTLRRIRRCGGYRGRKALFVLGVQGWVFFDRFWGGGEHTGPFFSKRNAARLTPEGGAHGY
ncbi:hypothetical protein KDX38_24755, partial [Pseudomonas sp. CDFA 602]|uniref:hypothetical protein n=1 Tax=Pseudomonas californiensis TaxID=2829823 RepID=UPI001E52C9C3